MESALIPDNITAREVVEGHYLETGEGLFFAVKGLEHPPDRWIAVLRYVPDPEAGSRRKRGRLYRRVYRFQEQEEWLRERSPRHLIYDPVFGVTLQSVPRSTVERIYSPRRHLQLLMQKTDKSALEDDAVAFLSTLQTASGVALSALGVTGSILIGLHGENSDMDVAVYGEQNCKRVHHSLRKLLDDGNERLLHRLAGEGMEKLYAQRVVDTKMDYRVFAELEGRKANQGGFLDRTWFVRFIKEPGEIKESYGRDRYKALGRMTLRALISDDADAIFTPCRYGLSGVEKIEAHRAPEPAEIVSFRGRFCEQARIGDRILATGTLERVRDSGGHVRYRLLLGNSPEDTMVVQK